jgi:predicted RNA-binding Zn ribbon-like protein
MSELVTDEGVLLDLLNSTPVVDGTPQDLLAGAAADGWLRRHGFSSSSAKHTRTARRLLQDVVRGRQTAASLAPLLDGVRSVPRVEGDAVTWTTEIPKAHRCAVRAVLAWDQLQRRHPGRLRPCANPDCALFLIDHSKPNRARWCSMAVCGNRMKARRHYNRTRPSQQQPRSDD